METFEHIKEIQEGREHLLSAFKKIRKKTLEKYQKNVDEMSSPFINAIDSDYIRKVSHEFALFLAELEKEIRLSSEYYNIPLDDSHLLQDCKNKIVDTVLPTERYRGTKDYQLMMRKASTLANRLEDFFMLAYDLGRGRKEISQEELDKIDEKWNTKCEDDLRRAYIEGTKALSFVLAAACADGNVMEELKDRQIL